jgi:hypothetical protein
MGSHSFDDLLRHYGHKVEVVVYGKDGNIGGAENVAIECEHCNEVLLDFDRREPTAEEVEKVGKMVDEIDELCDLLPKKKKTDNTS